MTDIFELSSRTVDELVELIPETGTALGLPGCDHRWSDLSPDGYDAQRSFWTRVLAEAQACETPDRAHEVAKAVLIADAETQIRVIHAELHLVDLNNIASPWQSIRDIFELMPDDTVAGWTNITTRLATIGQPLAGYRQCLQTGLDRGLTVAKRQVSVAIEQGRAAAGPSSTFNLFLDRFDQAAQENSALGSEDRRALEAAIEQAKNHFGLMTDWFESTYLLAAHEQDGIGRERYVRAAEQFLGETIDPEAVYAWGWTEIERLQARYIELAATIDPRLSVAQVMELLEHDPARAAGSVEEFVAIMLERQQGALASLDGSHFDVSDHIRVIDVKQAPPGGALAPYYSPPSEDFSRPGCVWYPTGDREFFPLFSEITTAYHEGFPGHHLQVGWQAAMGDQLSRYHRLLTWYPGSGEGWALYAETLMSELGFLETPDHELGFVASQMLRSCRIAIDIGIHCGFPIPSDQPFHPGEEWSFEIAVEMLEDLAFETPAMAESEVVRYFGWPGQAISYKIGEQAILDLRAERSRQPDFDLKQFHADVLSAGSTGLDLLRHLVRSAPTA